MVKSPFSTAGGGNSDAKPHECTARKHGGAVKAHHHHRADGGSTIAETLKEAKGKKSIGFVEGEDAKPRLDRKRGGAAHHAKGGKAHRRADGGKASGEHHEHGHEHEHDHTHHEVHHHQHVHHHAEHHGGRK